MADFDNLFDAAIACADETIRGYRLMRGYATGGYVGTPGSMADSRSQASGTFEQNNHVVINNDGTNGQIGPQALKAVYDVARKAAMDVVTGQMRDGGLFSGGGR
ncbi:head-tail joining protein [Escherichia coli]